MRGKTVIVTGSTSGIGAALAGAFAGTGATVVLNGLGGAEEIEAARRTLAERHGVEVLYHGADMTRPEEISDLIASTERRFGAVDILVNNAGVQHTDRIEDFPPEKWDALIAINLTAVFHATAAALPLMKRKGWGRVINVASNHAFGGGVTKCAYVATKHAVLGLTKVTALETAGSGITCNAICPGWVKTPLVDAQIEARAARDGLDIEEATWRLLIEQQPSGRFTMFEQLGAAALFLASDAAANMTGSSITQDGGWTAL
ncbi:3-hydroxybutyrate dehydrogenase [Nisaea acidiphila]|uniref:3-hydroxybutyrate dehydrogenase n=1 Tax=Nisaea acidiphila TaxID=1862145 RepID=A0A9J7ANJ3_9PROT|nr:3-hydroxybutyrate dehydrogenase [Nisaea acidiphila]UUX48759.1 3-hydroxybutyrate dehydrogenase [Nisaea acidiphila]